MSRTTSPLTALLALALTSSPSLAQDPARDLPHLREAGVPAAQRVQRITERLAAGWDWEAARLCRELLVVDDASPLPHALLALAMRCEPNRAARHCWDAVQRRGAGSQVEQVVVDALQRYLGVDRQPELVDERFAAPPPRERTAAYLRELRSVTAAQPGGRDLVAGLIAVERARHGTTWAPARDEVADVLRHHNAYLSVRRAMPFEVPGYAALLSRHLDDEGERARWLARLPRHPDHDTRSPAPALPGIEPVASPLWSPRAATGFTLPSGFGVAEQFDPSAGEPTLLVFFLGFGCAHCVAQLHDLDPKAAKFRAAGIEVVSIGTDTIEQVRAARQAAQENGVDPLHFDVLCDPKGEVFRQWGVWDQFGDAALHGTFLVDGKGRILWQDISERPFEQSDWLLAECRRLLAAWR